MKDLRCDKATFNEQVWAESTLVANRISRAMGPNAFGPKFGEADVDMRFARTQSPATGKP